MHARRVGQRLLPLALSLSIAGCSSWRIESVGPAEIIAQKHPDRIRVRGSGLGQEVLYAPQVHGDSLLGRHRRGAEQPDRAVPLADVTSVATHHVDAGKTAALGLGIVAALGTAALAAASTMDGTFENWGQ